MSISGLIGTALFVPLLGYAILPTLKRREEPWSEMGSVEALEVDLPKEFAVVRSTTSGWMKTESVRSVWALKTPEGKVVVYSPICPHLGCAYQWKQELKEFQCPCHNSVFDVNGRVLSGPAPRSLDTLPAKVEGDTVYIRYEEFKVGTPKKEVI
ncbi:MAG TPA: ubiquinol-cytochrome c reductase iron-sulfur subunit [Nitrospiria bacterium]|nr:ubiquinol-cytochrome c reductase iron-sulfur subunit [Nitrospiria bacterium]